MSEDLTKNARWIVVLRTKPPKDIFLGKEILLGIGRWSWNTPERQAIAESLIPQEEGGSQHTFVLDVDSGVKYAKQWQEVEQLAKDYFVKRKLCSLDIYTTKSNIRGVK